MKNKIITYLSLFLLFLLFMYITYITPLGGDDVGNYLISVKGIKTILGKAISMYFTWEGRFVSRLLIYTITSHRLIYSIITSMLMVILVYLISNLINVKNKKFVISLSILMIVLMGNSMLKETVTFMASGITYLYPTVLTFIYIYYLVKTLNVKKYKWYNYLISIIFSFTMTMYVENIAFAFVMINLIFVIYNYYKTKKINKFLVLNLIFSGIGAALMLFSPGSDNRNATENLVFNGWPIWLKLGFNYIRFIYYTFTNNIYLLILFMFSLFLMIKKTNIKKIKKIILCVFSISIPSIIVIVNILHKLNIYNGILINLLNYHCLYVTVYFSMFILIYIYIFLKCFKKFNLYFFIASIGIIANLIMLFSPTWGERTTFFTYIFLAISNIYIIDELLNYKFKNVFSKINFLIFILTFGIYITAYYNLLLYNTVNVNYIKSQKNNDKIYIYECPDYFFGGIIPHTEYHVEKYKEYYNLNKNAIIKYKKSYWNNYIFFNKSKTLKGK